MSRDGTPSDCMRESILWRMHGWGFDESIEPLEFFEEAYTTEHKMVRIYKVLDVSQESKEWRAAKGVECASEECYPPALAPALALKQRFKSPVSLLSRSSAPS
jgi:dolichyl-diphosphooligosaccharide--protein glycosyltransferase